MATNRRTKGDGSITKLSEDKYRIRVEVAPVGDKRKWVSKTIKGTLTDARNCLKMLDRKKVDGKLVASRPDTFEDVYKKFLRHVEAQGEIKDTTLQGYKYSMKGWLENLKDVPIQKLTTDMVQTVLVKWKHIYKHNTIASNLKMLNIIMKFAIRQKLIKESPLESISKRRYNVKRSLEVLSLDEHKALVDIMTIDYRMFIEQGKVTAKSIFLAIYSLAFESGMRKGEILGLHKKNLNFNDGCILVDNTIVTLIGAGILDSKPKTEAGVRVIYLSEKLMGLLKEVIETYEKLGIDSKYVFCGLKGQALSLRLPPQLLKEYLGTVGITRQFTFHDIRHTNASLLLSSNQVDIQTISERLGHSGVNITLGIYTHVLKQNRQKVAGVFQELLE